MEAMQYEQARNMTLLFFFERLLDKGEPRTLHDLSCQFGSKGFTKEMRQIAGGSQSGLKKFLAQYPSLFAIEGDYVNVSDVDLDNNKESSGSKDYAKQAVDYFSEKLSQYGDSTEVPIRSLLGHRSQASPEVRHVSGQHFHEFREFLLKNPESFLVNDENETVVLKNFATFAPKTNTHLNFDVKVDVDPQQTQSLLDFFAQCIDVKGPILVEQLFQVVSCTLPEERWSNLFNTPQHLTSFLRLFADSFHIQANLVTLLQHPKVTTPEKPAEKVEKPVEKVEKVVPVVDDIVNQTDDDKTKQYHSVSPTVSGNNSPATSPLPSLTPSSPAKMSISDRLKQPKIQAAEQEKQQQELEKIKEQKKKEEENKLKEKPKETKEKEPLVPKFKLGSPPTEESKPLEKQSLKQRINNLVLKTLQENTGRDQKQLLNQQLNNINQTLTNQPISSTPTTTGIINNTPGVVDKETWKNKIFQSTRVICNEKECLLVINDIMKPKKPIKNKINKPPEEIFAFDEDKTVVAFDCEGINLGVKGQITLMQIATFQRQSYIFDLISCPAMINQGLKRLLESPDVVKIIHDCRNDSVNLNQQFGINLSCVFDTQAAHAVLTYQETRKPVYKAKSVALNALCQQYGAFVNPMKEQLKNVYRRDQKYWSRRPLSREMILYASADVLSLIHENLYPAMIKEISDNNRKLLLELCDEQIFLHINPENVKLRKRQRKTETEVAELRSKLSQSSKSVVLSNREVRLLRYIELTEEEKEKLKSSAKVAKKLEKLESLGKEDDSSSEDDNDYPSIESDNTTSPRNSEPTSLTESMQMVDTILSDNKIDRMDKIDKLEAILSAASLLPGAQEEKCCSCNCHMNGTATNEKIIEARAGFQSIPGEEIPQEGKTSMETQTLSTGDIVITKIYFNENENVE
ncbi:uncharacterized protein egl [Atheta coriaria]|uniref:uncharacterized protein egl n=1 Tax=Dalotia coriaria TaxID=877792 RepID=UPI0031F417B8